VSNERSDPHDAQPDDARLSRLIRERRASSGATAAQIAQGAASLEAARALLADGLLPVRSRARGGRLPVSPRQLRTRRAGVARRRTRDLAARARVSSPPERGARLPCSRTGCKGVMQYSGEPFSTGPALLDQTVTTSHRGWVCSAREQHSHAAQGLVARGRWEDDGGSRI